MFSKLISRNSKRNLKENRLFFGSLVIPVIAFYMLLSLSRQDVMIFLEKLESDAVSKLLSMIPVFYGLALFILFFLIYYASKYQLERRRHEFGVYLMLGMRRIKLFLLLIAEDFRSSIVSLAIGLPSAALLSELVSLITARLVGIGIINHQISFSFHALLGTAAGFLLIKFAAFLILSGKISRQEIGSLLVDTPDGTKKQLPSFFYALAALSGICCLAAAYFRAISGIAWYRNTQMGLTILLGLTGTLLFFWGLRSAIGLAAALSCSRRRLHAFNFRQIQETVMYRSNMLAVCSLLILAALCCFGAGIAISRFYGSGTPHVIDYSFQDPENMGSSAGIRNALNDSGLNDCFQNLFEIRLGHPHAPDDMDGVFRMDALMSALREAPASDSRDVLLNNLSYADYPYTISLSGYNALLNAAGLPLLSLGQEEAAVYMDASYVSQEGLRLLNTILQTRPEAVLSGHTCVLTGPVQTTNLVADRSITLSFALIIPDDVFDSLTSGSHSVYLNGILAEELTAHASLLSAITDMNDRLDAEHIPYESYLKNMGRQLFYMVAASYITIYLAIIFLIIANTVIGTGFLMSQRKSGRRYRTLIRLGADHETLCRCARKQIHWYFGIPVVAAAVSSLFGVRALLGGILSYKAKNSLNEMMLISAIVIAVLIVVEWIYIAAVKRSSDHYLLKLTVPMREE